MDIRCNHCADIPDYRIFPYLNRDDARTIIATTIFRRITSIISDHPPINQSSPSRDPTGSFFPSTRSKKFCSAKRAREDRQPVITRIADRPLSLCFTLYRAHRRSKRTISYARSSHTLRPFPFQKRKTSSAARDLSVFVDLPFQLTILGEQAEGYAIISLDTSPSSSSSSIRNTICSLANIESRKSVTAVI